MFSGFLRSAAMPVFGALLFCAAPNPATGPALAAESPPPSLGLPVACRLGQTCWLVNHVDHETGPGAKDYACGPHTYNGHTGVDIAIRDYSVMDDGVPVVAAAAGTVVRIRDGMLDGDAGLVGHAAVTGRGCGNSVAIDHGGGWETHYCHLRRNSLVVRKGQQVGKGDKLGLVGSSGLAEFPHIHLGVRLKGKPVDPFVGPERQAACGPGLHPLWEARALRDLGEGGPTSLYDAGFAPVEVNAIALRRGFYREPTIDRHAQALVFWADAFWVHAGDRLHLKLTAPDGRVLAEKSETLTKTQARYMKFIGKRRTVDFKPGTYKGEAVLERETPGGKRQVFRQDRTVTVAE